jgi:hypothetical protein
VQDDSSAFEGKCIALDSAVLKTTDPLVKACKAEGATIVNKRTAKKVIF